MPASSANRAVTRLPAVDEAARRTHLARAGRWLALAGLAALVVTIGLGVVGATLGPPLPSPTVAAPTPGPASILPSPPAHRVVVDPRNQKLTVEPYLVGQLPGAPFEWDQPTSTKGLFDEAVIGGVTTDAAWKSGENLPPAIVVADLDPATVIDGDLPATARGVIAEFGRRVYQKLIGLKVTDIKSDDPSSIGDHPAQWAHATVTGTMPSGGDEKVALSVLLVSLPNGRCFGYIEIRPDHPSATQHFAAMDAAAASIKASD